MIYRHSTRVAGVDGTKGGWVAIVLEDGRLAADKVLRPVVTDLRELGDVDVIAIDVPIGFGPRDVDGELRKFLTGAASTVFSTPPRDVLEQPFGPGLRVSAQAHALGPRIIQVTTLAETDERIHEVHPEVSFRAMNDGRPVAYRKKSAGGSLQRITLLRRHGIELDGLAAAGAAPLDDVLDAAAAAWTADRIGRGVATTIPARADSRLGVVWY